MINLYFHLQPQYKYELFHIYYTMILLYGEYILHVLYYFVEKFESTVFF